MRVVWTYTMYQAMYVEKLYPNGCLHILWNWYISLRILSSLDEIGGTWLRLSSDQGTSKNEQDWNREDYVNQNNP